MRIMKLNLPVFFVFLVYQIGFSQSEKLIQGRVLCDDFPLQGIEIVNLNTEKSTKTDSNGRFSISAKAEDMLVFVSEKYDYKRLLLDQEFLAKNNFTILLTRKPEQLEEVVVTKTPFNSKGLFSQEAADEIKLEKEKYRNRNVYDGTIENGADLMRIGGMILDVFKKKKEVNKEPFSKIEFKELAKSNYPENFFINTLKLKPEEIALFLEFCDADPKSKTVLENANPLKLMDFLFSKNIEFKKLAALEKN
ncbi:MAG TPA: hypothetical protein DCM02_06630 [Flavobacterium sp.]|nr:hypothetical protein [Flavobacterium sp.]